MTTDDIDGHEFVAVHGRRWCLNCDLFQTNWKGRWPRLKPCPRNSPRAIAKDRAAGEASLASTGEP